MPQKLVVLEDSKIRNMFTNTVILAEFPFVKAAADRSKQIVKKAGCGSCGQKGRLNKAVYQSVKQAIARLPNEKKARLKQLLNADQLRLYYQNANGVAEKLTF